MAVTAAAIGALTGGVLVARQVSSPGYGFESAPRAERPECEKAASRYPDRLAGQRLTFTGRPGVAVWGDDAIVLRCGLTPPAPTVDPCANVNGVDWVFLEDRSKDGKKVVLTYGRTPAVEAVVSDKVAAMDAVLVDLSKLVEPIKKYTRCLNSEDV
ncbi:DUF3515 family protein [Streptomyces sp. ISL-96]|uniref:DUF3515 family protein n=1 Tax=Streptomyces sp. ISL-96 TaxID=2819191 RepID=UPI0020355525|nr:DUF3515 family protein [Streptomyces sp. ISL-96]